MKFSRAFLVATAILLSVLAHQADAQTTAPPPDEGETIPPSGLGATTVGERVILLPNGTWKIDDFHNADKVTAISDHGRSVTLTRTINPVTDQPELRWQYSRSRGGLLQIVISRAISTDRSGHSLIDNCIPVITVRNLTNLGVFRIVAEIEFTSKVDDGRSATSIMAGPLDDGEETDALASPLFLKSCDNLQATINVPYCAFENGLDCRNVITTTRFGTIPARMADLAQQAAKTKQN